MIYKPTKTDLQDLGFYNSDDGIVYWYKGIIYNFKEQLWLLDCGDEIGTAMYPTSPDDICILIRLLTEPKK